MLGSVAVERKIINVTGKRQITIPLKFYEKLDLGKEVECELADNAIIIRPFKADSGFATEILKDLVAQGLSGAELVTEFEKQQKNVAKAVTEMIAEADDIAYGKKKGATMQDVFGEE